MYVPITFNPEDRHLVVISGALNNCVLTANKLIENLDAIELNDPKKANTLLGQEFDAVIFHSHNGFDPNAFGAISGTIRCGGYLLLLKPTDLPEGNLFLKRFERLLKAHKTLLINANETVSTTLPKLSKPTKKINKNKESQAIDSSMYATQEQKHAVEAIIQVVKGHRRRPLVLTSDRGRGKSASLGIAAATLHKQGYNNIIICAPSKKIATTALHHASRLIPEAVGENTIHFFSPDDLQRDKIKADLVLVDEAAAIPISILTKLLLHYSRIVFASTQHGYEGSGRGFSINFKKVLDKHTPNWNSFHLTTPIRWNKNDSLEQFTFDALLLNAEPSSLATDFDEKLALSHCQFSCIEKASLFANENKLKAFFGLLVSAHYQTKPSDLMHLLNDKETTPYALMHKNKIIAVALIIREGQIDKTLSADIFAGKRRIKSHLVAQSLSVNVGIEAAIQLSGDRVSRIAVHPRLQNKGIGTYFLKRLVEASSADYISTSFGATAQLIPFWQAAGFSPVYLGMKRDASSGTHSVIMLCPKSATGNTLLNHAQAYFSQNYPHLLNEPLKDLEPELVFSLLATISSPVPVFSPFELNQLMGFAKGFRGYENSLWLIWQLVISQLAQNKQLTLAERNILIIKVLQKHSWEVLCKKMNNDISGKKEAISLLRASIEKLLRGFCTQRMAREKQA